MMVHEAHAMCMEHMGRYVRIQMHDGMVFDGVVEKVDEEHVYIACPETEAGGEEERYLPYPGYGPGFGPFLPPYPGYAGYPYGYYPRFRRYALPLAGLLALSLLPYGYYY
ncbi:hypothetical protein [Gorillibacterium sp. sgz5001074]|uniref:hypothetical protein n=1 Tax=Gorillibacterium sp. sgz5001074 TaxID=3446695 RepID=UPI003F66ADC1